MAIGDAYTPTVWRDEETVINATLLNKIETRIKELENAESLIAGKLGRARMMAALVGDTNSDSNRGAVALSSKINSTTENGIAATPKAVNDARLTCATTGVKDASTRKATLAVESEKLLNPIKISLTGGVSTPQLSIIGDVDPDKSVHSLNVTVKPEGHIHTRAQLDAPASFQQTGLCLPVNTLEGKVLGSAATNVVHLDVAINLNSELTRAKNDLSAGINGNSKAITDIINLADSRIANKPLGDLKSNVSDLLAWKNTFEPKTNSDIATLKSEIALQKTINKNFASVSALDSLSQDVAEKASKLDLAQANLKIQMLEIELEKYAKKEEDVKPLWDFIQLLALYIQYPELVPTPFED